MLLNTAQPPGPTAATAGLPPGSRAVPTNPVIIDTVSTVWEWGILQL